MTTMNQPAAPGSPASRGTLRRGLVLALALIASPALAQEPIDAAAQPFRSAVDLVTIQASVRDERGRVIRGLTPTDFDVRDNGERREVVSVRSDVQSPLSVAILLDVSGSMRIGPKLAMAQQTIDLILQQLRAGVDEAALFTFDSELEERQGFTTDLAKVGQSIDEAEIFGTTSLYDATAKTAERLADRTATHRAVVVLTDGLDTSSRMSASQVSGLASSIDVPVFIVATVPGVDQRRLLESIERPSADDEADLRDLAEWTGGRLGFATTLAETATIAAGLVSELRQQYVIAIEANSAREWRRLEVRVKTPAAVVKARSGYFGG